MKLEHYNALYIKTDAGYIGKILEWSEITVQASTQEACRNLLNDELYENVLSFQQNNKEIPEGYGTAFFVEPLYICDIDVNDDFNDFEIIDISTPPYSSINQFALDLYAVLESTHNLFFSPYSIASVLNILAFGARGVTQKQILQALHAESSEDIATEITQVMRALALINADKTIEIYTANALWVKAFLLLEQFEQLVHQQGASIRFLDSMGTGEEIADKVNAWCAEKTHGKITQIVTPDVFMQFTSLVITNALYFKADWDKSFEDNESAIFYLSAMEKIDISMMLRKDASVYHFAKDELQVLRLDYRCLKQDVPPSMSMIILLPEKIEGLAALEQKLTPSLLQKWLSILNGRKPKTMDIYLPSFMINTGIDLQDAMKNLGIHHAFGLEGESDFSGVDGTNSLFINRLLHKTFINVNETGTEAAAVSMTDLSLDCIDYSFRYTFRADHPFLFLIMENTSNTILFMGRVVNPLAKN